MSNTARVCPKCERGFSKVANLKDHIRKGCRGSKVKKPRTFSDAQSQGPDVAQIFQEEERDRRRKSRRKKEESTLPEEVRKSVPDMRDVNLGDQVWTVVATRDESHIFSPSWGYRKNPDAKYSRGDTGVGVLQWDPSARLSFRDDAVSTSQTECVDAGRRGRPHGSVWIALYGRGAYWSIQYWC